MGRFIDLTGNVYGRLTVIERVKKINGGSNSWWRCKCECGNEIITLGIRLRNGQCSSCKCLMRETTGRRFTKHGKSKTVEYRMLKEARKRAIRFNLSFNIEFSDIIIPEKCPILDVPLVHHAGKPTNDSPSLDRVNSSLGYIKGNIQVICMRANRMKQDSTIEELQKIIKYMQTYQPSPLT